MPRRQPSPEELARNRRASKKILTFGCLPITVLLVITVIATSNSDSDTTADGDNKPTTSAPALTDEQRASIAAAAGLPPEPDPATRKAFLDALNAIDPRIAKPGKDDQTIDRGRNQCASIKSHPDDRDKLVDLALDRFTISTRLPDISTPETGGNVLDAVHKHLCPDF